MLPLCLGHSQALVMIDKSASSTVQTCHMGCCMVWFWRTIRAFIVGLISPPCILMLRYPVCCWRSGNACTIICSDANTYTKFRPTVIQNQCPQLRQYQGFHHCNAVCTEEAGYQHLLCRTLAFETIKLDTHEYVKTRHHAKTCPSIRDCTPGGERCSGFGFRVVAVGDRVSADAAAARGWSVILGNGRSLERCESVACELFST